jgi:peptide/nickel transport system substrate-binding protein
VVYSTLFRQDYVTFDTIPHLAVNYEMRDPQTLFVEIQRGVTFHNGDPLTAHDVAFSLPRAAQSPDAAPILGMISHAEVIDNYSLTIHTHMPFAPLARHLAHPAASIVPMNLINQIGDEAFAQNPVGSGPFMFYDLVIGDQSVKVRFDDYWGTPTAIERLVYRVVPDPSTSHRNC